MKKNIDPELEAKCFKELDILYKECETSVWEMTPSLHKLNPDEERVVCNDIVLRWIKERGHDNENQKAN